MTKNEFLVELAKLGINLTKKQINDLEIYAKFLLEYNSHTNLTAITELNDVYLKHFYDSLTIVKNIDLTKIANLNKKLENGGVFDVIATLQKGENLQDKISKDLFNDVQELETNKQYLKFVYKRRDSKYISATLKEVRPIVEIMPSELNKNPYLPSFGSCVNL